MDHLVGLTAFAEAARVGSYTEAARTLGVSPSAVSKSISRLERRLGVQLFARTTRALSLTPEGEELFRRCGRLLDEVAGIESAMARARNEVAGSLRVSAPLALGRLVLAPALSRFRAAHPRVGLDLRLSDERADLIAGGIDIAIRIGDLSDSRLVSRRLAPHRVAICASPDYLAHRGVPRHPVDLAEHDCIRFRFRSSGRLFDWPFQVEGERREISPPAAYIVDEGGALAELAASGAGVTAVASYIAAPFLQAGRLVSLLQDFATEEAPISLLYPAARRQSPALRAFVEFAVELIPPRPLWDEIAFPAPAAEQPARKVRS